MIPKSVWNIHAQVVATTIPGTTQGISVTERRSRLVKRRRRRGTMNPSPLHEDGAREKMDSHVRGNDIAPRADRA